MADKVIRLNYSTAQRFLKDFQGIRDGRFILATAAELPLSTGLVLELHLPAITEPFRLTATVARIISSRAPGKTPAGVLLHIGPENSEELNRLAETIGTHAAFRVPRDTMPATGATDDRTLPMEWLRQAVTQPEAKPPAESEESITPTPRAQEKKILSAEERAKVKPVADFVMALTKAMLRSGYYDPEHPASKNAKHGLYATFQRSLGNATEIMLARTDRSGGETDFLVTGVLEEPLTIKNMVGGGMAELFLPKLREYFNRKSLLSLAIKKQITAEHFNSFIDIMCDPRSDRVGGEAAGRQLTASLVAQGIDEISTVFLDDLLALDVALPWRVEMAIQRLAKDLKVLPMFVGRPAAEISKMKVQIVQDIIRPLRHPALLKDLIINCHIIAGHVESLLEEDLEKTLIASFPLAMLLPTSSLIFRELRQIQEAETPAAQQEYLGSRIAGIKRLLKWIARRVIREQAAGAGKFLERLYLNDILTIEELPQDLQDWLNTLRLARDVSEHPGAYSKALLTAANAEEATTLLLCLKRVAPFLLSNSSWPTLLAVARATAAAPQSNPLFKRDASLPDSPEAFVFQELCGSLAKAYQNEDQKTRESLDEIIDALGMVGVEILSRVLAAGTNRVIRIEAVKSLAGKGTMALEWVRQTLDHPEPPWYLKRNALLILQQVGSGEEDIFRARRLLKHNHARLREEALRAMIALQANDAEAQVISALQDTDDRVRHRALESLSSFSPLSAAGIDKLLDQIAASPPPGKEETVRHAWKVARLLRALATLNEPPDAGRIEAGILDFAKGQTGSTKKIFGIFKKTTDREEESLLPAALTVLGKFGGVKSLDFLDELARSTSPRAEEAKKVAARIRQRSA